MSDQKAKYEGMFLLEAGNPDFQSASEPIRNVLDRNEATALSIKPWDERRLAYEIKGRRRGLYVLTYFEADPLKITEIENDCSLDERIMRVLVLRRYDLTEEEISADTPATGSARQTAERRDEESKPAEAPAEGEAKAEAEAPAEKPAEEEAKAEAEAPAETPAEPAAQATDETPTEEAADDEGEKND